MTRNDKIAEAFDALRAPEDTYDKILARSAGGRRPPRRGRALPVAVVAAFCAGGILAAGGTAYAVVTSDFFLQAWGSHGLGEESSWTVEGGQGEVYAYSRDFNAGAAADVPDEVLQAAEDVGLSVEGNGFTLTVDSMVVDDNGCGAATFTLANPDGIGNSAEYGTAGELGWLESERGLDGISMIIGDGQGADATYANSRCFYDVDTATDTELHGTVYFDTGMSGGEMLEKGVRWNLAWHTGDGEDTAVYTASSDVFKPRAVVRCATLTAPDGRALHVSPFSLRIEGGESRGETLYDRVVIGFQDGSTYAVEDQAEESTVVNNYMATLWDDDATTYTFTQLVDTSRIASVTVTERTYPDGGTEAAVTELTFERPS